MLRDIRRLAFVIPLAAGLTSCAEEREPINRVQPDALAKTFFIGELDDPLDDPEFFWRNFVIDGTEAQSMIGIGTWSGVDRIRWEITEDVLFAHKAYPISPGATPHGDNPELADGLVVAAYPIEEHFDIRRSYNPTTGEELNVIEENKADRPWYDRAYMRVDFSLNLVDTPQWNDMFVGSVFGDIAVTNLVHQINDPDHPHAPHFDIEDGYFDVTSRYLVEPAGAQSPFVDFDGTIPGCILAGIFSGSAVNSCDPQEAVVRSSFWRVDRLDPDEDFEPFENTHASLDIIGNPGGIGSSLSVGVVTPPQIEWDPQYGYTDANLRRYMHVHDTWEQSHQTIGECSTDEDCEGGGACLASGTCSVPCDYENQTQVDGSNVQCTNDKTGYDGSKGSQCSAKNRCTIPYRDRAVEPIAYWMSPDAPAGLLDVIDEDGKVLERGASEDLIYSWNQALELSVAKAREVECRNTGDGDRDACHAEFFVPGETDMVTFGGWGIEKVREMDDVIVFCHNPVRETDPEICGEPGYEARLGDIRHNFLFYYPYESRAPYGGIANWNADPLTGQILGASATVMGRSATRAAAMVRDIIMVANDELSMEDITGGTPATLFERELEHGHSPHAMSEQEIAMRIDAVDAEHLASFVDPVLSSFTLAEASTEHLAMLSETVHTPVAASQLQTDAILDSVRGSVFEAQLVDPSHVIDVVGAPAATLQSDALLDAVSPIRGLDNGATADFMQRLELATHARGICYLEHHMGNVGNNDVQGIARRFKELYPDDVAMELVPDAESPRQARAELIYTDLWKEIYKGIALHEIGHSLGMLHQFASSYDSPNFLPQYWQLRTQEGKADGSCLGTPRSGNTYDADEDSCMGPRYLDPETDDEMGRAEESRPGINYFAHTSTMEYQHERFFETVGLGQYDLLTMNVLYGRVLQTFDERAIPVSSPNGTNKVGDLGQTSFGPRLATQRTEQNYVYWANPGVDPNVFVQPMHYTEQARQMKVFEPDRCRPATDEEKATAAWRIVHGKVCQGPAKDYARWDDFEDGLAAAGLPSARKLRVKDDVLSSSGNFRWPFRWGVSSNAYAHTNPGDAGADIYEVTMNTIRQFRYNYPFRYFRQQNRDWSYRHVPARTASSFYERLRSYHWGIALDEARFQALGFFDILANNDDWHRPYVMAQTEMFSAIAEALLMPQVGDYGPDGHFGGTKTITDIAGPQDFVLFSLDASNARYIEPNYNDEASGGGSWQYQEWLNWTGFSVEKGDAARALTDGREVFFTLSRENFLDGRNINVNFRSDMPKAVDRLIGGILAEDWDTVSPYIIWGEETPNVSLLNLLDGEPTRPDDAMLLKPNIGYKQQLSTMVWAHTFSRLNGDLTLVNKLHLWIDGADNALTVPEEQKARFYNPESGYTYVARRYGTDLVDGKLIDGGIASRMVERAQMLMLAIYELEVDEETGELIVDEYGLPFVVFDANGTPVYKDEATAALISEYKSYVGLLDAGVQLAQRFGHGPLSGSAN